MADTTRTLFDFTATGITDAWLAINDGVMGGVSEGGLRITDQKTLEFSGRLSLENGGGFASVRTKPRNLGLKAGDVLVIRVRGDGREYAMNLYVPTPLVAFSYRAAFGTQCNQWVEVTLPVAEFRPTRFGRPLDAPAPDPAQVDALGFLLADRIPGPFGLEVEWIRVECPHT